jgi:hypothetical protein
MAFFIRQGILAVFFMMALFSTSCEKHPLGQMPEVQREQPDPATRVWSEKGEIDNSVSSPTPAEAVPHGAR